MQVYNHHRFFLSSPSLALFPSPSLSATIFGLFPFWPTFLCCTNGAKNCLKWVCHYASLLMCVTSTSSFALPLYGSGGVCSRSIAFFLKSRAGITPKMHLLLYHVHCECNHHWLFQFTFLPLFSPSPFSLSLSLSPSPFLFLPFSFSLSLSLSPTSFLFLPLPSSFSLSLSLSPLLSPSHNLL